MQINYRGLILVLGIAALLIVLLALIAPPVDAVELTSYPLNSSVTVIYPIEEGPLEEVYRIHQGENVYLNDTLDISGVTGWPDSRGNYYLLYFGRYETAFSPGELDPSFILQLPDKVYSTHRESQYRFYIDPAIFTDRPGYWYQWTSNTSRAFGGEPAGNLRAFKVISSFRPVFNTTSNQTEIIYKPGNYTEPEIKPAPLMPERHIADYVVARGDNLTFSGPTEDHRLWLFGRVDGIYGVEGDMIASDLMQNLEEGTYTMIAQSPGNNTIYDASCGPATGNWSVAWNRPGDPECGRLIPGLYGKAPVDIPQPSAGSVVRDMFMKMLAGSDDTLATYKVEVKDPYITLDRADEVWVKGTTYLDVRGYSNVADGTPITVVLDNGKSYKDFIKLRKVTTSAVRTSPGNLSYYRALVLIDWENLAANAMNHTLTASTALGGSIERDFKISIMPKDSYRPNATLKYIEDRNPFVPTPTPVVNTVIVTQTVKVVETVKVIETPDESDYFRIGGGLVWGIGQWAAVIVILLAMLGAAGYGVWVLWRGRKK